MTSEVPATTVNTQLVQGSKPPTTATSGQNGGKSVPTTRSFATALPAADATAGRTSVAPPKAAEVPKAVTNPVKKAASPAAKAPPDLHAVVAQINKHLQGSGRPNTYKLDSSSGHSVIQEINPDTQQVIGEMPAAEFKALAQELGISGQLVDAKV